MAAYLLQDGIDTVSDSMIGISQFVRGDQLLAVPIRWAPAASLLLITAGLFVVRASERSGTPAP